MSDSEDTKDYDALDVPDEARGAVELLRVAVSEDKLFLSARPALKDPAEWGEILAELTRRLGVLYDMGDTGFSEQDVIVAIEEAYAADMGAHATGRSAKGKTAKRKPAKRKPAAGKAKKSAGKKAAAKKSKPAKRKTR